MDLLDRTSLSFVVKEKDWFLKFRLQDGLALLKNLQALKELDLSLTDQELQEIDVRWMMEHWPRLRVLKGNLHSDQETIIALGDSRMVTESVIPSSSQDGPHNMKMSHQYRKR